MRKFFKYFFWTLTIALIGVVLAVFTITLFALGRYYVEKIKKKLKKVIKT